MRARELENGEIETRAKISDFDLPSIKIKTDPAHLAAMHETQQQRTLENMRTMRVETQLQRGMKD